MAPEEPPPKYAARLLERREVAERTMAFHWERPPKFDFTAGQFLELTLDSPEETDAEGNTRAFSIASSPHEPTLMITTRMRDTAFKRNLARMKTGSPVTIAGPFGDLTLHEDASRPAVILTGGIGITPFRSIVLDAAHRRLRHHITLFSSNRRPEDAPFIDELTQLERRNPSYRFVPTMTQAEDSTLPWAGERGPIDLRMLSRYKVDLRSAIHYIAGPPGMVKGLREVLTTAGVEGASLRTEEFDGY